MALAWPARAAAQQARPSPFAIDTAASIDETIDRRGNNVTGVFMDAVVTAGLGRGFEVVTWPIVQRVAATYLVPQNRCRVWLVPAPRKAS